MCDFSRRSILAITLSGTMALCAAAIVSCAPALTGQQWPRADHYTTAPKAELVPTIGVMGPPYKYTTLYSLKVPGLKAGDIVQVHGQFEVTNDLGFNVMLAHAVLVYRNETIVAIGERPEGHVIAEYAGENVTPGMHHGFRTLVGSFAANEDGDAWLSLLIYAASSSSSPGNQVQVMRGYGGLRAVVIRN